VGQASGSEQAFWKGRGDVFAAVQMAFGRVFVVGVLSQYRRVLPAGTAFEFNSLHRHLSLRTTALAATLALLMATGGTLVLASLTGPLRWRLMVMAESRGTAPVAPVVRAEPGRRQPRAALAGTVLSAAAAVAAAVPAL
jgi:hypothetical protein